MSHVSAIGGPSTAAPTDGSRTITLPDSQPREASSDDQDDAVGSLQLMGGSRNRGGQRVVWSEDVVDNEGTGKKSSKICCIYHKPKRFDESSSEESSDSDSDSSCGHNHHTPNRRRARRNRRPNENGENGDTRSRDPGDSTVHELDDDAARNKYDRGARGKPKGKTVPSK